MMAEQHVIPLVRLRHLMELVISRVEDKSSVVRKQAISLLTTLAKCNPFGDKVE